MPMSGAEIIRFCIDRLYPEQHAFAEAMYARLFERLPGVEARFVHNPRRQETMLFAVLSMVLRGMEAERDLGPELRAFGRMHYGHGVRAPMIPVFGTVFIETLTEFLPEYDHPELIRAWWEVYGQIAEAVIEGMDAAAAAFIDGKRVFSHPGARLH